MRANSVFISQYLTFLKSSLDLLPGKSTQFSLAPILLPIVTLSWERMITLICETKPAQACLLHLLQLLGCIGTPASDVTA